MFNTEEISICHGKARLTGTLYLPETPGPHPALVMIQGSGPTDRKYCGYFEPIQKYFMRSGIATLAYDKPGTGQSDGNWKLQSFLDRANEALAAVELLRSRSDIRADKVGVWGHSQGGWIAPLAASLSKNAAFVISVAGPGIKCGEQNDFAVENSFIPELIKKGRSQREIDSFRADSTALGKAALENALFLSVKPLFLKYKSALQDIFGEYFVTMNEDDWTSMTLCWGYDPKPVLEKVTCPILAVFGEMDDLVPSEKSAEIFRSALKKAGNRDVTIRIFPKANHGIFVGNDFAPGFLQEMNNWILERINEKEHI